MRYVQIDTQADPASQTIPSSLKQLNLSRLLVEELKDLGVSQAEVDNNGYVYATIPASPGCEHAPIICFCSHVDTAPDCSGTDVKPRRIYNYQGQVISYPDDPELFLTQEAHPYLKEKHGEDLIVASGKTLLGADDKAGVAIIMELAAVLMKHPHLVHGPVRILFTPDEEIGRGVDHIQMDKVNAQVGFNFDGGERGHLEGETFSADAMTFTFKGISAHPGYAKGKLVHAIKVAAHFIDLLPKNQWSPETTEGKEPFVHPVKITGELEEAKVQFIIRDFDAQALTLHEAKLVGLAEKAVEAFPGSSVTHNTVQQYRNMREILDQNPRIMDFCREAYRRTGLEPIEIPIRGGTDGSRLSFMGLPCPNLFTGEMAIHSKVEYCSVQDMEAAVKVGLALCDLFSKETKDHWTLS
jgi:tripeptide aminopeptidase